MAAEQNDITKTPKFQTVKQLLITRGHVTHYNLIDQYSAVALNLFERVFGVPNVQNVIEKLSKLPETEYKKAMGAAIDKDRVLFRGATLELFRQESFLPNALLPIGIFSENNPIDVRARAHFTAGYVEEFTKTVNLDAISKLMGHEEPNEKTLKNISHLAESYTANMKLLDSNAKKNANNVLNMLARCFSAKDINEILYKDHKFLIQISKNYDGEGTGDKALLKEFAAEKEACMQRNKGSFVEDNMWKAFIFRVSEYFKQSLQEKVAEYHKDDNTTEATQPIGGIGAENVGGVGETGNETTNEPEAEQNAGGGGNEPLVTGVEPDEPPVELPNQAPEGMAELEEQMRQLVERQKGFNEELKTIKGALETVVAERNELKLKVEQLENENAALVNGANIDQTTKDIIERLTKEKNDLTAQLQTQKDESAKATKDALDAQEAQFNARFDALERKLNGVVAENTRLTDENRQQTQTITDLENQIANGATQGNGAGNNNAPGNTQGNGAGNTTGNNGNTNTQGNGGGAGNTQGGGAGNTTPNNNNNPPTVEMQPTYSEKFQAHPFRSMCVAANISHGALSNAIRGMGAPTNLAAHLPIKEATLPNGAPITSTYGGEQLYTYDNDTTRVYTYAEAIKEHIANAVTKNGADLRDEIEEASRHNPIDLDSLHMPMKLPRIAPSLLTFDTVFINDCRNNGYNINAILRELSTKSADNAAYSHKISRLKDSNTGADVNIALTGNEQFYTLNGDTTVRYNEKEVVKALFHDIIKTEPIEQAFSDFGIDPANVRRMDWQRQNGVNTTATRGAQGESFKAKFLQLIKDYVRNPLITPTELEARHTALLNEVQLKSLPDSPEKVEEFLELEIATLDSLRENQKLTNPKAYARAGYETETDKSNLYYALEKLSHFFGDKKPTPPKLKYTHGNEFAPVFGEIAKHLDTMRAPAPNP